MKAYCISCKKPISPLDFYVESKQGRICSDCLVAQPALRPGTVCKNLGRPGMPKPDKGSGPHRTERFDFSRLQVVNLD